jgi:tetratricopeptide (TPR) repeat protein
LATLEEAWNYARQALAAGRFDEAEPVYKQMLAAAPQLPDLWHEMGLVLFQTARPEPARECLERAVSLAPQAPDYLSNLGAVYRELKRRDDAADCFRRALAAGTPTAEQHNNLALALKDLGEEEAALAEFDAAIALRDDFANGHFNRANLLLEMGRLREAQSSYRRAIELEPEDSGAWCKLGVAHYDAAEMEAALACFDRALELKPEYSEPRRNRAMVWLAQGDYARGWPEFEHRLACDDFVPFTTTEPRWKGEPLAGRTVLLHAEQGLGDTLQFVRYVPLVEKMGGTVKLHVQPPLAPLLRASGFDRWLLKPDESAACDVQCPLLSLPGYVPNASGEPFWGGAYLSADPQRVADWAPRIRSLAGYRIGIVWAGNPDHPHNRFRSAPLRSFAPLARIPDVQLISLQKGAGREQLEELGGAFAVTDLGLGFDEEGGAFLDSAAVMQHLDLVISVDTAIAHLAGGLSVPTWVALQQAPDWRWKLSGNRTPWYPSLRLFRQASAGDWPAVFTEMAYALQPLVAQAREFR